MHGQDSAHRDTVADATASEKVNRGLQMNKCGCEYGENCTTTTVCERNAAVEEMLESLDEAKFTEPELRSKLDKQRQRIKQLEAALASYIDHCQMCATGVECQDDLCFTYRTLIAGDSGEKTCAGCGCKWKHDSVWCPECAIKRAAPETVPDSVDG